MAQIDPAVVASVNAFIHKISQCGINVESAYLFGSFACNVAHRWSDIDVAIISPDFSTDRLTERIRLMQLSAEIDSRIEPIPFRTSDFNDEDPLAEEIKKRGIPLI
ncbi:MAG: nucleotidyltransferase domain-containing protein [Syntrophales bacterium]|nr:nucleotidyltransferase domain-containing protein [Syntrophales bacterium]